MSYPFLDGSDSVMVGAAQRDGVLRALIASNFVGAEWAVRADATHGKSKTYPRLVGAKT